MLCDIFCSFLNLSVTILRILVPMSQLLHFMQGVLVKNSGLIKQLGEVINFNELNVQVVSQDVFGRNPAELGRLTAVEVPTRLI